MEASNQGGGQTSARTGRIEYGGGRVTLAHSSVQETAR